MEVKKIPTPPQRPVPKKPIIQKNTPVKTDLVNNVRGELKKEQPKVEEVVQKEKKLEPQKADVKPVEKQTVSSETQSKQVKQKAETKTKEKSEQSKEVTFGLLGGVAFVMAIVCFVLMFVL